MFAVTALLSGGVASAEATGPDAAPGHSGPSPKNGHEHAGFRDDGLLSRDQLLGDPGGVRSSLEASGITVEALLIADLSKNISGGVSPAGTFRHLFDFAVAWDLGPAFDLPGGTLFADFQTQEGQDGSLEAGDLQAYSNIDADDFTAIYEIWYEQVLLDGSLRFKLGKIDANTEFGYVDFGGEFIHSSPGLSPTAFVMPQYPDPAFGALGFVGGQTGTYFGAGLFDGALQEGVSTGTLGFSTLFGDPADLFMVAELGHRWAGLAGHELPGRLAGGVWHHTGSFARLSGGTESHTTGVYVVFDQLIYKESADPEDKQGIGLFAQYGWADPDLNAIEHHVGLGVQWAGALPGRGDDVVGLMMSWAGLTDEPGAGLADNDELAVEWFYRYQATGCFALKPAVQYIANPGGAGLDDAWVLTLRAELSF